MSELDICNMKYDYSEVGEMFKASKALYSWEFTLDGKRHKVELNHSRITGKRVILSDAQEISSCLKYTYNYTYSFPLEDHYLTLIQISPDQYDLRIDNISFMLLKNKIRYKKNRIEQNKKKKDDDDDDDDEDKKKKNKDDNFFDGAGEFYFGDNNNSKSKKKVSDDLGDIASDFDFGDNDNNDNKKISPIQIINHQIIIVIII